MGLIGAILGDIAGSQYEFDSWRPKDLDWNTCELFTDKCFFTDDSVMSIATKLAIDNGLPFADCYKHLGKLYPNVGYGCSFESWIRDENPKPYGSYGNGSAMRVSYVADTFRTEIDVIDWATKSAECTHNHPEGIKGAIATAMCSYMGKTGKTKTEIYEYAKSQYCNDEYLYDITAPLEETRKKYRWDLTCQGSVPIAIRCFLESEDYESCLRNVFSLRCDMDTLGSIAGGIAESFYGNTGMDDDVLLRKYLDDRLYKIVSK
jgi:ADP-ribosylglycohydrolase